MSNVTEHAAGGIIIHQEGDDISVLLILDRTGEWTFPKGHYEEGESAEQTALREVQEEAGITNLAIVHEVPAVRYWYKAKGLRHYKEVRYFVMRALVKTPPSPQHDEGITDARWMELQEAKRMLGYPITNLPILESAVGYIQRSQA